MLIKYVDISPLEYDLYTLFIEESPNMRGQLSCYHCDTSLLNIHDAVSRLVPRSMSRPQTPVSLTITLFCNGRVHTAVADLHRQILDARPRFLILPISCSFWEILPKSYVGTPLGSWRHLFREILDLPLLSTHHLANRPLRRYDI